MRYLIVIDGSEPEKGYGVTVPDLPGCTSEADTVEDAIRSAGEAIACHLEGMLLDGETLTQPSGYIDVSRDLMVASVDVDVDSLRASLQPA